MRKKAIYQFLLVALVAMGVVAQAQAHRMWILPSATVLSGDTPYVTFDAAVSNAIFFPDHVSLRLDQLTVNAPDGEQVAVENVSRGRYRSTFDLPLSQEGTYKVSIAMAGLRAFWKDAEGKRRRWPRRGETADDNDFESAVPKTARDLRVIYDYRRIETFVTAGNLTTEVFAPTGVGLELVPVTHPNDLYAGETAEFKLLMNGEPAHNAEVILIPEGTRYRNSQNEIIARTDSKGLFRVTWPAAGRYFMEAEYEDDKANAPATKRRGVYSATFEVLPL